MINNAIYFKWLQVNSHIQLSINIKIYLLIGSLNIYLRLILKFHLVRGDAILSKSP